MDIREILKTYDQPIEIEEFEAGRDIPLDVIVLVRTVSLEEDSNTDCVMWGTNETLTGTVQLGMVRTANIRIEKHLAREDDE